MSQPVILTNEQLRACCDEWQRRLRLQDWTVLIRRVRAAEYGEGKCVAGQVEWGLAKRAAVIKITEPEDYALQCNKDFETVQDMEITVVHELLHLHTAPFTLQQEPYESTAEEQAIDAIARALVSLKRGAA